MLDYGLKVREIRTGKGYSQKYVYEDICTQGNYSKFETGENKDIKFAYLTGFIERLDLSLEEFLYIANDYKISERSHIIKQFFSQSFNNENKLKELEKRCELYLKEKPNDALIGNIRTIYKGMIILAKSNDFNEAKKIIEPIWDNLSKRNMLYLSDLYLLNSILFVFPLQTAIEITKFALRHIEKYGNFQSVNKIKLNFLTNLAAIYLNAGKYKECASLLEETISLSKSEQTFINLSICYIRKGICLTNLNNNDEGFIQKGLQILEALEQTELRNIMEAEVNEGINKDELEASL